MTLDPRLLQSFVVLADELHFGRAAKRLNLAQPALSQQIQRLERQVTSPLFTRNSRVVELTASGRAMLVPARAAIRSAEQAERAAREAARTSNHPLRVGVNFLLDDVVPVVAAYAESHLEVRLWISRMVEPQGHELVAAGQLDAFVGAVASTEGSQNAQIRAIDIPLLALMAPDHPIARLPAVPLSAFRESPIAMAARDDAPETFDWFVEVFSEGAGRDTLSIREHPYTATGKDLAQFEEVRTGDAVGFGTPGRIATVIGHLRSLPFDPQLAVPTYVSWQAERSKIVDTFVQHLACLA